MITAKKYDYKIILDEERGCIASFVQEDKEYIYKPVPLLSIRRRNTKGEIIDINAFDMQFVIANQISQNKYELCYKTEDNTLYVTVTVIFEDEIKWKIEVENKSDLVLECVDMSICVPSDLVSNGGKSRVLWGYNEGVIIENIEQQDRFFGNFEPQYPGKGMMPLFPAIVESQFMAYYDGVHGLYLATHDNEGYMKGINLFKYNGGIKLWYRFYTDCDFGDDYKMSYFFVMKTFSGDWYKAADIYKNWFEANKSDDFVPIAENKNIPEWYGDSPVVITYPIRGVHDTDTMNPNKMFPYINGMKSVERLAEKLNSKIMVILMHWEGTAPWAPPYVWPPYGGEAALKEYIDALHKKGHLIGLYCSGLGWTQYSKVADYNREEEFEKNNLKSYMCVPPDDGEPKSEVCTDIRHGYDLCPKTEFAKRVMTEQAKLMMDAGVDYIQLLDQNHGGTSYFCYGREHGHPTVPGKWQTDAVNDILNDVHKQNDKVLIGCESAAAESYIPNLLFSDNRFNLAYAIGKPTPVYAYIYHKYLNNFMGNQVNVNSLFDHDKNPENLFMRIAHSFCAGDMLTLVLNQDGDINWNWGKLQTDTLPDQDAVINFVRELNELRVTQKKYLHFGEMEEPFKISCEKYALKVKNKFEVLFDCVFTSKWRAKDNTWAQFLVNYTAFPVWVGIDINEECVITDKERQKPFKCKELEIPAQSVIMLRNQ